MSARTGAAVIGAADLCGEALIEALQAAAKMVGRIHALDQDAQLGKTLEVGTQRYVVDVAETFDFSAVRWAFFAPGTAWAGEARQRARQQGCEVVDLTRDADLAQDAIQADVRVLERILKPLQQCGLSVLRVTVCQAVAARGRAAVEELLQQTRALLTFQSLEHGLLPRQLAFNVLPVAAVAREAAMANAVQVSLDMAVGTVQVDLIEVPVLLANSYQIEVQLHSPADRSRVEALLTRGGVECHPEGDPLPSAVTDASGQTDVHVGIKAISATGTLQLWAVADAWRVLAAQAVHDALRGGQAGEMGGRH